ncbi:hypothetical protein ZC03_066 [Pseudomonas phage ZC03]|uniref:Uncharacterized protein n=2 Tax=Zicotriavirus TaxID=2843161 RepID=A0A1L2C962_9CAUD|nr:hypothetical protein HWA93_gp63 [Pseudomonas phage ZC03]YP_009830623.1 hypothetical protein HWA94_gp65 [Pseudomonas phage ZC08]AMD43443.1 hypothetical protein ZC03_066 [Pseudomonas phage ZC03]AMD43504.1 hypothetical protein ZC08_061 [Pseudomonas phage ZC08]
MTAKKSNKEKKPLPGFELTEVALIASFLKIEALEEENEKLRQLLKELVSWIPSADTYRRLGFDPEAPMRAYKEAKAVLGITNSKENA